MHGKIFSKSQSKGRFRLERRVRKRLVRLLIIGTELIEKSFGIFKKNLTPYLLSKGQPPDGGAARGLDWKRLYALCEEMVSWEPG